MDKRPRFSVACYSGLFDPFTRGHVNIVIRTLKCCDRIVIAVENPSHKKCTFTVEERVAMAEKAINDFINLNCGPTQYRREIAERIKADPSIIKVVPIDGEVVDTAIRHGANIMVRGIRNEYDQHVEEELMDQILLQFRIRNYPITENQYEITNTNGEVVHMSSTVTKDFCERREYIAALHHLTPSVHNMIMSYYLETPFSKLACGIGLWSKVKKIYLSRAVHNFTRVAYMLNRLQIERKINRVDCRMNALRMAMMFCHICSTPQESAEWVEKHLQISQENKDRVKKLILLTDYSKIPLKEELDVEARTMLRCCLLLLTDKENYPLYLRQMRVESGKQVPAGYFENIVDPLEYLENTGIFTDYELGLVKANFTDLSKKK